MDALFDGEIRVEGEADVAAEDRTRQRTQLRGERLGIAAARRGARARA